MIEPIRKCDGFDTCVVGHVVMPGTNQPRLVYSCEKVIDEIYADMCSSRHYESEEPMPTFEDALEYFEFNILCAYVGEGGPLFMWEKSFRVSLSDYVEGIEE